MEIIIYVKYLHNIAEFILLFIFVYIFCLTMVELNEVVHNLIVRFF